MKNLGTISEIKKAVDNNETVYADSMAYTVVKAKNGDYLIKCITGHCIGLHGMEGTPYETKLNATTFWTV